MVDSNYNNASTAMNYSHSSEILLEYKIPDICDALFKPLAYIIAIATPYVIIYLSNYYFGETIMGKWIIDETDLILHENMSIVGGFLGAYAILQRGGTFGSAQTANMILLTVSWFHGGIGEILIRVFSLLIYISSLTIAYLLPKYIKVDTRYVCIIAELVGVVFLGFLPADMNNIIALYPILAISALQWGTFGGAKGYVSSSVFSTNNLKQSVFALVEYCHTKKREDLRKFKFYVSTLVFFHFGVVVGYLSTVKLAVSGIWICLLPLTTALGFLSLASYAKKRNTYSTVNTEFASVRLPEYIGSDSREQQPH